VTGSSRHGYPFISPDRLRWSRNIRPTAIQRLCAPLTTPAGACARRLQEKTVPKSRVRKKSVYTPPPRTAKAKFSPPWLAPAMLTALILGLAWIAVFYVTGGNIPGMRTIGDWNLVVGFGFIIFGVVLSTKWR
jgi:hypothetical protein